MLIEYSRVNWAHIEICFTNIIADFNGNSLIRLTVPLLLTESIYHTGNGPREEWNIT